MMPPRIDVHVEDSAQGKRVIVHADVPGIPKENVRLTLSEDNVLCISGERREERGEPGSGHYERSFGTFRRMVRMPGRIDRNKIDAKMEHGVLRLEVPLVGPSEEHQIEIK